MSFIDYCWIVVAIVGGHIVSGTIIAVAKKAFGIIKKESD